MLTIHTCTSADAVKGYFKSSDYYVDGVESDGRWGGKGAELLGLSGAVDWKSFESLADNLDPRTGKQLTARMNDKRRVAYDFTFSAPKSVSLLYEFSRDERILQAFEASIDETMRDIEREAKTRVRKGGAEYDRVTGNLAHAGFTHFETRPGPDGLPDPQLHRHVVTFNVTYDKSERRWKAGQFGDLKRDGYYWEAAFHSRLSHRMAELGYGVSKKGRFWEVDGVSQKLRDSFSRRTAEVEQLAEKLGVKDPKAKAKLGATSRKNKQKDMTHDDLRDYWVSRLTKTDKAALNEVTRKAADHVVDVNGMIEDRTQASVAFAVDHCFERTSVLPEKRVLMEALRHGFGSVLPEGVAKQSRVAGLFTTNVDSDILASTKGVLEEESRMIAFAREGRGTMRPLAGLASPQRGFTPEDQIERSNPAVLSKEHPATPSPERQQENATGSKLKSIEPVLHLSPEQQAACWHVWNSRDRVTLVRGGAGTGKTTMMQAAISGIDAPVTVLAPSAEASRGVLRSEGFEAADTLAKFLQDQDMQDDAEGGVIWVDESGLIGSRDMARLFDVAKRVDARIVLSGDGKQHASPARGAPLRILQDYAGLKPAELTDIKRQKGMYKDAVKSIEKGDLAKGFDKLDQLGWVLEVNDADRYRHLAAAYIGAVGAGESALVVSPTHSEGNRITAEIRQGLKAAGKIGVERQFSTLTNLNWTSAQVKDARRHEQEPGVVLGKFGAFREDQLAVAPGDLLRITQNGKSTDGNRLNNGSVYEVAGFTPKGGIVLTNKWEVPGDFRHFTHGYVTTSHAAQGKTVDRVIIGQSAESFPATNREQFYVSASRGRQQALIFTDDKEALKVEIQRSQPKAAAHDLFPKKWKRKLRDRMSKMKKYVIDRAQELMQLPPERTPSYERS